SVLRQCDGHVITEDHIRSLADWTSGKVSQADVPFKPARVILQDFTGVPAVVDLASMRAAMGNSVQDGQDKSENNTVLDKINPEVPVDLVIDHSVQVDFYGTQEALDENMRYEFGRNKERYQFLSWAQKAFDNFTVVPPATGIIHQVNLEYLAQVVLQKKEDEDVVVYPD